MTAMNTGTHAGHDHGGHDHAGHSHAPAQFDRAFAIGIGLNLSFVVAEAIFGLRAGSLALLADAAHNLGDVIGLVMAWVAAVLSRRGPTQNRTYGLKRTSVLAALFNSILLLIAIGGIAWEAAGRLRHPQPVSSGIVIAIASLGIVINTLTALLFARGRKGDINIRGAYLHMAADAAVSAAVVIAGIVIRYTGWFWVDPAMSFLVVTVIAVGTWSLLRDSVNLSLDAVPKGIEIRAVQEFLEMIPGVVSVHDLHIWGMSTTEYALTAHVIKPDMADEDALLVEASNNLKVHFGIHHATLQIERGHGPTPCALEDSSVV